MTLGNDFSAPLVVIVGATGAQGGSIVKALDEAPTPYRVRGITRNGTGDKAQSLRKKGVEIFEGDIGKLDEGVRKALDDADVAYLVTNFWDHLSAERETSEGINFLKLVSANPTISLVLWSGLEPVTEVSGGKYSHVVHFDSKAKVTAFGQQLFSSTPTEPSGGKKKKFVNLAAGFYAANLLTPGLGMTPRKQPDGTFKMRFPVAGSTKVPLIDTQDDYGLWAQAVIEGKIEGNEVLTWSELISWEEICQVIGEVTGKNITYEQVSKEIYIKEAVEFGLPEGGAEELNESLHWFQDFGYYGPKKLPSQEVLSRKQKTFKEFVTIHKEKFLDFLK